MLSFQVTIVGDMVAGPLPVTFDQAFESLQRLPRMFIEPDGSFVWTDKTADGQRWQVDGNLIDRGDFLAYVEFNGQCPQDKFDDLLRTLGWPAAALAFQLTRSGLTLSEADFRAPGHRGDAV